MPLFNEVESLRAMYDELTDALDDLDVEWEIILVDDGSTDGTDITMRNLHARDERVTVIRLRRNFGQTSAMVAGIEYARGDVVVTIDGDLQNDPRDIGLLVEKIREGRDIIVGWRRRRKDRFLSRVLPSIAANWLISAVTGVKIHDNGCSLKAYNASLIKCIPLYNEMHRFIPAMSSLAGANIAEVEVRHHPRRFGKSKYGLSRIYKVLIDLIVIRSILAFSQRPATWGMVGAGFAFAIGFILMFVWLLQGRDGGIVVLGLSLLFSSLAVVLVSHGLLALLVLRSKGRDINDYSGVLLREVPIDCEREQRL